MKVSIVGMGPGDPGLLTNAAVEVLRRAQAILGARRALDTVPAECSGKRVEMVRAADIASYVREHGELDRVCIAVTGDAGVFSGARTSAQALADVGGVDVEVIPGISAAQYLAARLQRPWQDWRLISAHGVACDVVAEVCAGGTCAFFTGGAVTPGTLCDELTHAGLGGVSVVAGERLSYPDERIVRGTAAELAGQPFDGLSILLVEGGCAAARSDAMTSQSGAEDASAVTSLSPACGAREADAGRRRSAWSWATGGIPDDVFERGDVPMTKQEVRAVTLAKLRLASTDAVWDIGAGTGACTVEFALAARCGRVFAVERKPEAVDLVRTNVERFGCENVEVVGGAAPKALADLPVPDAVFVGGSGGALAEILDAALALNPAVRVCVPCIALETLGTATALLSSPRFVDFEACQVSVTRSRKAGPYHLMQAQNPIFLLSARGAGAVSAPVVAATVAQEKASS